MNSTRIYAEWQILEWDDLWAAMRQEPHQWIETTFGMADKMISSVPPQDMGKGCFLVGEPTYHNAQGEAVYACFKTFEGLYHAKYQTQAQFTKGKEERASCYWYS